MKKFLVILVALLIIGWGSYLVIKNNKNLSTSEDYWTQGVTEGQRGNPDKAIEVYEQGLKIYPKDAQLTCAIGFAYEDKYFKNQRVGGDYLTKAISYYEQGVDLDSNSVYCRGYLAEAYFYAGDYSDAWKHVNILTKQNYTPPSGFISDLSSKMANPEK